MQCKNYYLLCFLGKACARKEKISLNNASLLTGRSRSWEGYTDKK